MMNHNIYERTVRKSSYLSSIITHLMFEKLDINIFYSEMKESEIHLLKNVQIVNSKIVKMLLFI